MATTVHRKHQNEQGTYLVVPATDATGREVGDHVFQTTDDGPEYVGEGDAVGDWEPNEELSNDDAPQSVLDAARSHRTNEQNDTQATLADDVEPETDGPSEEHRRAQNNGYLKGGSRGFDDDVSARDGLGKFVATGGETTLESFETDGGTKQRQPPLSTSPEATREVRQSIRQAGPYQPTNEYDELEEPSEISPMGEGRRKTLDALDTKGRLGQVQTFNTVEEMIDAIRELSLAHRDGRTYMSPPKKPVQAIEAVYRNLPDEAKREFLNDDTLHRRINAARNAFNDWMGKKRREQKMPSPVEAGPSNYPAEKARETSRYAKEAKDELKERIKNIRSGARGARQRALQAIGSSVAEQNAKEAQSEIEAMRETLEPGDVVLHFSTEYNWVPWGVKRVNKKSVRLKRPHQSAGMEKAGPYENGTYPEYDLTTVDLDSDWLRYIPPEAVDTLNDRMDEFHEGNVGEFETFESREETLRYLMGDDWVENHPEVLKHE